MPSNNSEQQETVKPSESTTADSQDTTYVPFHSFNLNQWIEWLNAFLSNAPHEPLIPINKEEPHHSLIDLYKGLGGKPRRDLFAEAIKLIFEATQRIEENKEQLYYLLHIISFTVPLSAKQLLRQRLYDSVLNSIEYGNQNLQTLLLIANSKYEVDDDLVDYIRRSARSDPDYRHLLACLRILASRGGTEAYPFVEYLVPHITKDARSFRLARQLKSIGQKVGYKHFFDWYRQRSQGLAQLWPRQWHLFQSGLKERLLNEQSLNRLSTADPYAAFLMGLIHADLDELAPSTVLGIARLYKIAGKEDTAEYLFEIWRRGNENSGTEPWTFLTSQESLFPNTAVITTGPGEESYDEASFDSSQEDELEEVFLQVSDRYNSLIVRESVKVAVA